MMRKIQNLAAAALCLLGCAGRCAAAADPADAEVERLLQQLTPEEKIALVHGDSKFTTAAISRLGIPQRWLSDGPMGVREDVGPYTWDPADRTDDFSTALPCGIALAASFDPALAQRLGEVIGEEARARGKDIMLGPAVNIQRSPLCGRNWEYLGEDPWLTSRLAVAYINGVQSRDVAACVKHFALNNQETQRDSINVEVDDRALHEIYLPAFEAAVKEAHVLCVMGAYNKFRGQYCCANELLMNTILRQRWQFKGLTISDWGGVHDTHDTALFGVDLEMGSDSKERGYDQFFLAKPYLEAIDAGSVPASSLDEKVRRNLYVMFKTGMLKTGMLKTAALEPAPRFKGSLNTKAHQETARQIAGSGIVLLKNDSQLLPIDPAAVHSIAVIGDFATRLQAHGGESAQIKSFYEVSPLEGILRRFGSGANVVYAQGYRPKQPPASRPTTFDAAGVRAETHAPPGPGTIPVTMIPARENDEDLIARAVDAARSSDLAVVVAGNGHAHGYDSEGRDRHDLKLPFGQDELIRRVLAANPRTVIVLITGGAVEMPWIDQASTVVEQWYGGMEAGDALADALSGDVNPSGRLPCTFPKKLVDSPAHALGNFPGANGTVRYEEGLLVGYRWYDARGIEPLFPFGFGLSYTTFGYANLNATEGGVQCDVTNTGARAGDAVVEVYVHPATSDERRPPQELKGLAKASLRPGETRHVSIPLAPRAYATFDPEKQAWFENAGAYEIRVGGSSRDLPLHEAVHIAGSRMLP